MANIRLIKRRIRSIQNTAKITRAMEMVAASKMRRAQERGLAGRPYSKKMIEVISDLTRATRASGGSAPHPLLDTRGEVKNIALVFISTDRGMCGGLVSNLNRKVGHFYMDKAIPVNSIAVGRKSVDFLRRTGRNVMAEFTNLGDRPSFVETLPISRIVLDEYSRGAVDEVYIAYSSFVSTVSQLPIIEKLLPVDTEQFKSSESDKSDAKAVEHIYEPDIAGVLNELLPRYVEMRIYQVILESIASEQSARMVAMRNATSNAKDLVEDLTLQFNKARQDVITRELLDITAGKMALEQEK
ncbi:MAG: ATP synthase F1 subunit gamma [Dehalococcoidales bacterium]